MQPFITLSVVNVCEVYFVIVQALHTLYFLNLKTTLEERHFSCSHFTSKETESQRR